MKKFVMLIGMLIPALCHAQSYTIDWFKISGGGGTSSNGQYVVSGTIGQPDAGGPMTNGQYSVTGGFWVIGLVQSPTGPLLKISATPTNSVIVTWPSPSTGFLLQTNASVTTTNWVNFTGGTNDDGTNKSVVITPPAGNLFFRLKK